MKQGGKSLQFLISRVSRKALLGIIVFTICAWSCQVVAAGAEHAFSQPATLAALPLEPVIAEPVTVLQVVSSEKDGYTTVEISLSGRTSCNSFVLSDPLRLVVDMEHAILRSRPDPILISDGVVERVRIAQFNPSVVRVVFDLSRTTSYTVVQAEDNPDIIEISFPKRVTGVEFFDRDGRGEAVIRGTGNLEYETSSLSGPPRIVVDLPGTVLTSDVLCIPVSHPQVTQVRVSQFTLDTVRVVLDLERATTYSVVTSSDRPGEVVVDLGYRILGASFTSDAKSTEVSVVSSGNPEVKLSVLTAPHRIVLDFENSTLDTTEKVISVGDDVVERIRLAQYGPMTVRAVLDLNYYVGHALCDSEPIRGTAVGVFKSPIYKKTIVLDPGHGGTDPGAVGSTGLYEKSVVLDIAKRVAAQLEAMGAKVALTRSDDVSISLPKRVSAASNAHGDAFISIHANASRSGGPTGTETLYANKTAMSKVLAEYIQTALVSQIGQFDRGARERNDLMVLREAKCPACLVEVVFMSNLTEELLLLDPAFRQKAAKGIVNGIVSYFRWRKDPQSQMPGKPGEEMSASMETVPIDAMTEPETEPGEAKDEQSENTDAPAAAVEE